MSELFTESTTLLALDAKTGEPRWTYRAKQSILHDDVPAATRRWQCTND